jgi:hypothetical protein
MLASLALVFAFRQTDPLSDPVFSQPITMQSEAESFSAVLNRAGEKLHVHLYAAPGIADQAFAMEMDDRPAREGLSMIAQHFNLSWEKKDDGYRLFRSPAQDQAWQAAYREQSSRSERAWRDGARAALNAQADPARHQTTKGT